MFIDFDSINYYKEINLGKSSDLVYPSFVGLSSSSRPALVFSDLLPDLLPKIVSHLSREDVQSCVQVSVDAHGKMIQAMNTHQKEAIQDLLHQILHEFADLALKQQVLGIRHNIQSNPRNLLEIKSYTLQTQQNLVHLLAQLETPKIEELSHRITKKPQFMEDVFDLAVICASLNQFDTPSKSPEEARQRHSREIHLIEQILKMKHDSSVQTAIAWLNCSSNLHLKFLACNQIYDTFLLSKGLEKTRALFETLPHSRLKDLFLVRIGSKLIQEDQAMAAWQVVELIQDQNEKNAALYRIFESLIHKYEFEDAKKIALHCTDDFRKKSMFEMIDEKSIAIVGF